MPPTCAPRSSACIAFPRRSCIRWRCSFPAIASGRIEVAIERYEALTRLAASLPHDALVVSTYIGAVSFEWAAITEEHPRTAQLGQMGDVIGLAVGLALALPKRRVVCIDGDGSVLMELGQLVVMGQEAPANLAVFVIDNGVYESIGSTKGVPRK